MPETTTLFVEILLPLPIPGTYTYRVPREMNEEIVIGKRVSVPFGKKKLYSGIITEIHENPPSNYQAKYIIDVIDDDSIIHDFQLPFWRWIADYYLCALGDVMNAALPSGLKLSGEAKAIFQSFPDEELDNLEHKALIFLENRSEATLTELGNVIGKSKLHKVVRSLYSKGALFMKGDVNEAYHPKMVKHLFLQPQLAENEDGLRAVFDRLEKRAPKQLEALMAVVGSTQDEIPSSEFIRQHNLSVSAVKQLVQKDILGEVFRQEDRVKFAEAEHRDWELSPAQQEALDSVRTNLTDRPVLLRGVTSSGKTEVYFKLIEEQIEKGNQTLLLIPEIALTIQLVDRLQRQFGEEVIVSHSRFSKTERVEIWEKVRTNQVKVIAGPRSALFLPFEKLGLIIVDEEHEHSYKQYDPAPRFHSRDCAVVLANMLNIPILLSSATPSVESAFNAHSDKYALVELTERFGSVPLPHFEVVDFFKEKKMNKNKGLFSASLIERMEEVVGNQEQVILFQNRKGYVPFTECHFCGWTPRCVHCDISLTYYKFRNELVCHYCGYHIDPIRECGACGSTKITMEGYGTERVEEELKVLYPDWNIVRMDQNTTKTKSSYEKIIQGMETGATDVLIGTQMVTKGLDFAGVRLVGVLNADHFLNFPDFRSAERAFQTLVQVSGRAGRRTNPGTVMIQTGQPQHPVIKWATENDYSSLYHYEVSERQKFNYPPTTRLIRIHLKHKDYHLNNKAADYLKAILLPHLGDSLLGPISPHIGKIRSLYIKHLMIKMDRSHSVGRIKKHLRETVKHMNTHRDFKMVRVYFDVDPY
jgi:primosomal protein N' (replication factor Y)